MPDHDLTLGAGRVQELAITSINTHMADAWPCCVEEDHVAFLEGIILDLDTIIGLRKGFRRTRQADAMVAFDDRPDQAERGG